MGHVERGQAIGAEPAINYHMQQSDNRRRVQNLNAFTEFQSLLFSGW
jgi:hypothetical protein